MTLYEKEALEHIRKEVKYLTSVIENLDDLYEFDVQCDKEMRVCKVKIRKVGKK